jgi:hypothetical protein
VVLLGERARAQCAVAPSGETILEEDDSCSQQVGASGLVDTTGHGGHAYSTPQDVPSPNYAQGLIWKFDFSQAGSYEVWAYIPGSVTNLSDEVIYKVQFAGEATQKVPVDQAAHAGDWFKLGSFSFASGADQWMRLGDNFSDPAQQGKNIAFDAIKLVAPSSADAGSTPGSSGPCTAAQVDRIDCGPGAVQERTCGSDGQWQDWGACSIGGAPLPQSSLSRGSTVPAKGGGCSIGSRPDAPGAPWLLLAAALGACGLERRRGAARRIRERTPGD